MERMTLRRSAADTITVQQDGTIAISPSVSRNCTEAFDLRNTIRAAVRGLHLLWYDLMMERDSKFLTMYMGLNLVYIIGDLGWGCWASNLAFVSDATHMFFDIFCSATSLAAMVLARKLHSRSFEYSYGLERLEILCGFTNASLLILASALLVLDAAHRTVYADKSHCEQERPVVLPMYALMVNSMGLCFLWVEHPDAASVPGSISNTLPVGTSARKINLGGVSMHMLSDACENLASIASALMLSRKGWVWADLVLSLAIAAIVVLSAIPLLRESAGILLQMAPSRSQDHLAKTLGQILLIDGVLAHQDAHFWSNAPNTVIGSIRIQTREDADEGVIQACVREAFVGLVHNLTVQVEKPQTCLDSREMDISSTKVSKHSSSGANMEDEELPNDLTNCFDLHACPV